MFLYAPQDFETASTGVAARAMKAELANMTANIDDPTYQQVSNLARWEGTWGIRWEAGLGSALWKPRKSKN